MAAGRFLPRAHRAGVEPGPDFFNVAPRLSVVYDLFGNAKTALKFSANKYVGTLGAIYFNPYNPGRRRVRSAQLVRLRPDAWHLDLFRALARDQRRRHRPGQRNRPDQQQPPSASAAPRRADPNLTRESDWDYQVSVQHELLPRVSVIAAWYHSHFTNLQRILNERVSVSDYIPFQTPSPLNNGEMVTVYNLNPAKRGLVDNVVTNSDSNRRVYNGFEASVQARLPNGAVILWRLVGRPHRLEDLRHQQPQPVPLLRSERRAVSGARRCADDAVPERVQAGAQLPAAGQAAVRPVVRQPPGRHRQLDRLQRLPGGQLDAAPALFPGGRSEVVTINLIPPGTEYLKQWNQVDVNLKQISSRSAASRCSRASTSST